MVPEWQPDWIETRGNRYYGIYRCGFVEVMTMDEADDFILHGSHYRIQAKDLGVKPPIQCVSKEVLHGEN